MSELATPQDFDQLFARVSRRRRVVKILRWAIPVVGGLTLLALLVPLVIANLVPSAQFEAIRLEQDNLVVDAPRATGTLADGGTYEVTASTATTKILNQDLINLVEMRATLNFPDGEDIVGTSDVGAYSLLTSILTLPSQIDLLSSQGDTGIIGEGVADLEAQIFDGDKGVAFDFADGSTLRAINMHYDGAGQYWKFERASLTLTPQEKQADND